MKLLITFIRTVLGSIIVFFNWLFKPSQVKRSLEDQALLDQTTSAFSLYQFHGCPFCVKVRREIHRLNLKINLCDVNKNDSYRSELLSGGGKVTVPCLKINSGDSVKWLYESSDINYFLNTVAMK